VAALTVIILILSASTITFVKATNESSYQYGYEQGSLKSPQIAPGANWNPEFDNNTCRLAPSSTLNNGIVMPAVTNTTACINGWFSGYKNWCINHRRLC
jgi:hypothetical protein